MEKDAPGRQPFTGNCTVSSTAVHFSDLAVSSAGAGKQAACGGIGLCL